ncbi:MAG: GT2 family glycosyltransferase [Dinoroseobacter sp.]|jgi:GT2 family glycosyltransferase
MFSTHIIIVNYNAGDWLIRSVRSALAFSSGQISIVDNASSDNSIANARAEFSGQTRLNWIENADNRGFAAANNQVLETLEADFAVLMNPDCEINEQSLPLILNAFSARPTMGIASCRILNEDGSLQSTCRRRFPTPWSALVRMLQLHKLFPKYQRFTNFDYGDDVNMDTKTQVVEAISGAFMVVKKTALKQVGLLDQAYFMHCEDLDWCKRFEQHGSEVGFVSGASVLHAKGVSSASRPINVLWTLHLGMNRFFDTHYSKRYPWPLRYLVKLGIGLSFLARATLTLLRGVLPSRGES